MTNIYEQKQVRYSKLETRMFAAIIDIILVTLICLPIFKLYSYLIFHDQTPLKVMMDFLNSLQAQNVEKISLSDIQNSEVLYNYYFTNKGFLKIFIEQILKFITYGIIVILFWYYKGATLGKMIISAKIVDKETLGPPTLWQLIIRFLGYVVSLLPLGLGFLRVSFDKKHRQALHDRLAGTIVIKK